MKKFIALALCLSAIFCMAVPAMAKTNTTVLSFVNEATYEIEIPADVAISSNGTGVIRISVSNANLAEATVIQVHAEGNYDPMEGSWFLSNVNDPNDTIGYSMYANDEYIIDGSPFLTTYEDTTVDILVTINNVEGKVGTFTDTITFVSSIS